MTLLKQNWVRVAFVVLVALLPYLTTLTFGFVYDDRLAIVENSHLRVWPGFGRIFFSDIWSLSGLSKQSNYYRPMFLLAYEGVYYVAGASPGAFHLLNILFHAAATVMVFLLTLRFWQKESTATIAAILFALHPVHVEPVAWIAALSELAYTFFVLVAVYFYAQEQLSRRHMLVALMSYAMALLWKESAIAFAPLAILYDILVLKRWRWTYWTSIGGVTLAYLCIRAVAIGGLAPTVLYPGLSLVTQILTAISNIAFFASKLLAPIRLSAFYQQEFVNGMTLRVAVTLVIMLLAIWKFRGKTAWAGSWIVASLFPVLLVSRIAVPVADRDLYLPSVGFVWLAAAFAERLDRKLCVTIVVLLTVSYGALTVKRLPYWRDDLPLLEQELRQAPENQAVRLLLASELGRRGRFDKAASQLDEILIHDPHNKEVLENKAGLLTNVADWAGVRRICTAVLAIDSNSAHCLLDLGYLDENEGRLTEAHEKFVKAFRLNPELSQALLHQGIVEAQMGDLSAAVKTLETAVQRNPTAPAFNNLGSVYANRGEMKKAVKAFENAVRVDPTFTPARQNLERALADSSR